MPRKFDDFRDFGTFAKEESIKNRLFFINGLQPRGFVFIPTKYGNSFHIIGSDGYTICSKKIYKTRRRNARELIVCKNLSEIKLVPSRKKKIHSRKLCIYCENLFIGLYRRERYKIEDNHVSLFSLYEDTMFISKHLLQMLKDPCIEELPKLKNLINFKNFKIV